MKVLIADKLSPDAVTQLEKLGLQVEVRSDLTADALPTAVADVGVLVVRSTKVTAKTIDAAPQLALIIRAGAGVDTIDLAAASAKGIYVANCPGKNTLAVAELAIGMMVAADRRIVDASTALRNGQWKKKEFGKSRGLAGRTLGIIGFGAIGRAVWQRATALGMKTVTWSPLDLTPEQAAELGVGYMNAIEDVAKVADVVTIHCALTPETKHLVGKKFFDAMKPGTILINTSRGPLVDMAALKAAIVEKKLRVGMDVFENEPAGGEAEFAHTELAGLVTCTPHIGASTDQAADAIAAETVRIVKVFLDTGRPAGTVNLATESKATHRLVVKCINQVGVLAGVLDGLRDGGVSVESVESTVFAGGKVATFSLLLDRCPGHDFVQALQSKDNILTVSAVACK
jgi:D-3-phosphoglycerate dehydrogenase / 2-oxoglutarate reductase